MLNRLFNRSVPPTRLPRLTVAQRVIDKIVANAMIYETETGEALVGLAVKVSGRPEPDLYVLDTIPPDDAIRHDVKFVQGDDFQQDMFNWLHDNWEQMRDRARSIYSTGSGTKWDAPLSFLGNWHKHPGTLTKPSWGDADTARDDLADPEQGTPQVLVMLATVWNTYEALQSTADPAAETPAPEPVNLVTGEAAHAVDNTDRDEEEEHEDPIEVSEPTPIKVPVSNSVYVRIDCWYMSRNLRRFVRLNPMVVADSELPQLPPPGWHLTRPERLRDESERLIRAGYSISVEQFDADRVPPREICFSCARPGSSHVLILVTQADYPATMPNVRTVPISVIKEVPEHGSLFEYLWKNSTPLAQALYPRWTWKPEHHLIDLARDVEASLVEGNKQHEQPKP